MNSKSKLVASVIQSALVVLLIILVGIMIKDVDSIQGNAKVINYAGLTRGETQRLVKLEIMGQPNDGLMDNLDSIISDLKNGGGKNQLTKLTDDEFVLLIRQQELAWHQLKQEIFVTRAQGVSNTDLLEMSEEYFQLSNRTVYAAENYTQGVATHLNQVHIALTTNIVLIILSLFYQVFQVIVISRRNKELSSLAFVDASTGLPNKGTCDKFLYEHGILSNNQEYACIMFDLNNLKVVNDTYGHKAGDCLIINFANIIRNTAPENVFVGRYGGDEFITVLSNTNESEVKQLLEEIDRNIMEFGKCENGTTISYAAGYELSGSYEDCTLQILMDKADKKMYIDKAKKKEKDASNN